ncbi:MAG: PAS domain S-box protein [Anaerolineales bacterium]|nr:PAS domain S-box protein [Anaerolineales bacterium]
MVRSALAGRRGRTLLWISTLLVIFAFIATALVFLFYQLELAAARGAAMARLQPITALKLQEIDRWRKDRHRDAYLLSVGPLFAETYAQWLTTRDAVQTERIRANLLAANIDNDYTNIILLDAAENERFRLYPERAAPQCRGTNALVTNALATGEIQFGDIERCVEGSPPQLVIAAPLTVAHQEGAEQVGVLLLYVDVQNKFYPLLQEWPLQTSSAETLLVERDGGDVLFLNDVRHAADTALSLRIPLSHNTAVPAVSVVLGNAGSLEGLDYRGVAVLADSGVVDGSPWRIVSKMDLAEVIAPINRRWPLYVGLGTGITLLAGSLIGLLFFAQRHTMYRQLYTVEHERAAALVQYETLLKSAGDAILLTDAAGVILQANARADSIYGYGPEHWRQLRWIDLTTDSTAEAAKMVEATLDSTGSYESIHRRCDGTSLPVEVTVARIELDGQTRTQAIVRDTTQRKQVERVQAQLLDELRIKNEELESILYAASHDLRSPLVNIQGFSKWLQIATDELRLIFAETAIPESTRQRMAPLMDERIPTALRFIQSGSARMDTLIAGILRLSRLGRAEVIPTIVDMDRLVAAMTTTFSYQMERSGATIVVEPLPSCFADPNQLAQLFSNLLDNALKYRDTGRNLLVKISGERVGAAVVYQVADNGIGIPDNQRNKIWEIFHRVAPSGEIAGEGLGLAICRRIVERNHGRIWVESEAGAGSRFYVQLPASVVA